MEYLFSFSRDEIMAIYIDISVDSFHHWAIKEISAFGCHRKEWIEIIYYFCIIKFKQFILPFTLNDIYDSLTVPAVWCTNLMTSAQSHYLE